jgi:hypothetical protein
VLGGVDACAADGEADEAGEGAAFYCCAGRGVSLGGFLGCWDAGLGCGVLVEGGFIFFC